MLSSRDFSTVGIPSALLLLATGCGVSPSPVDATAGASRLAISGHLHGGQQPVSGALIQLYATNSTADQGASTPLLNTSSAIYSDANGNFNITGDYTCPSSNPLVYLVATGGNPGLGGSVNNGALAMMSLLGTCNDLRANASTTFIFLDELTTVVSVYFLQPFIADYAHVGASPSNAIGIGQAFADTAEYISFATGTFQNSTYTDLPEVTFNSLADILAPCVNSSGNTGSGSSCGQLFSYTTANGVAPTDTIGAALNVARSPGTNAPQLFGLIAAAPPFQPAFSSAPSDFTATTGYTLPYTGTVQTGVLASNGTIWLYTAGYTYNTLTDTSTNIPGVLTVYDTSFNQLFTISQGTGGLYYPTYLAADASGNVWAVNSNNKISKFNSSGTALSPTGGWATGYASTFSPTGPGNYYQTPSDGLGPIVTDRVSGLHGAAPGNGSNQCYFDMNSSGALVTPTTGNFCAAINSGDLEYLAVDGAGDIWAGSPSAIGKETASMVDAFAPYSQGCFYTSGSSFQSITNNLLYDHAHNYVWGYSELGAGAITNAGAALFCDYGTSVLPVIAPYTTSSTAAPGSPYSAGSLLLGNAVLDGGGNLWYVTGGVAATGTVAGSGTFNGSVTYSTYLNEISPTGALLTTYNAGSGTYGLQPAGLGTNGTARGSNISVGNSSITASLLGVDNSGNIWAYDSLTNKVLKITGLAAANSVNY